MYSAIDIANWFLAKNNAEAQGNGMDDEYDVYDGITHLKLQKLIYNAQGVHLAICGEPLFSDEIVAWKHGPVVKDVYSAFREYGKNPITKTLNDEELKNITCLENDKKAKSTLELVYDNFNIYTAWQLREMSHAKNGPWDKVYDGYEVVISNDVIKDYFEKEIVE